MAKKGSPQKRSIRCEKDHPGCMWGLLRIFDLRHRHPVRRLVSERRQGNSRHAVDVEYSKRMLNLLTEFNDQHNGIEATNHNLSVGKNLDESTATKFDSWGASVKTLIAEEMSKEQNSKRINSSNMIECPRSFLEQGNYLEKKLEATLTCRVSCDSNFHGLEYSEFGRSSHPNLTQNAPVEVPCHQDLQEKLGEAVEAFLNQKFINAMCLSSDGTHQSKEMMDALEILNSNKELFLRLLQDPNSLLVKHIQRLQDAQTEKLCRSPCRSLAGAESSEKETGKPEQSEDFIIHEPFQKHNSHRFFRKRDKSQETKPPKESNKSQKSTSIVVLKPNTARIQNTETSMGSSSPQSQYNFGYKGESERVGSNFSLKEIKRKLKQAIGESRKERERISKDGVLDRIPYGHRDPRDPKISIAAGKRSNTRKQRTSQTSIDYDIDLPSGTNNLENLINLGPRESVESVVSREAKKHIAEKLGPEGEDLRTRQVTRPLGRILSLPEYKLISPGSSPARELEPTFFSDQIRFSSRFGHSQREKTFHCSSPSRQNIESSASRVNLDGGKQNGFCIRGDSSPEGVIETEMANNVQKSIEENEPCVVPSEPDDDILVIANCVEERSTETIESGCSGSDIFGEKPSLDSPAGFISSSALLAHEIESSDMIEKLERPSPISVLEPFFSEDVISPASSMSLHAEFPITPRCIHFEESALSRGTTRFLTTLEPEIDPCFFTDEDKEAEFDYVSTVLEASGLSGNELLGRWHSSDEPLGPSLFDIVEGFPDQFSNNRKLLFDCVNQVLMEVSMQYSGYAPWISLVKPKTRPVPLGKNLVQEVWAGISWHLSMQSQSPRTLDQIVERDMEKRGSWMDLQSEAEYLGVEMEETILEDLVNETILELGI